MKKLIFLSSFFVSSSLFSATFNILNGDAAAYINAMNTASANGQATTVNLATNGTYAFGAAHENSLSVNDNELSNIELVVYANPFGEFAIRISERYQSKKEWPRYSSLESWSLKQGAGHN